MNRLMRVISPRSRSENHITLKMSFNLAIFLTKLTIRINKFFDTDLTIKVNVKKQRRFDRSTVILKLKSEKIF